MTLHMHPETLRNYGCASPKITAFGFQKCLKCWKCKQRKSWEWTRRSLLENWYNEKTIFLTLTYRSTHHTGYEHFQKYLKRLRKQNEKQGFKKIRYFVVTERGDAQKHTGRLHLHCLLHCDHRLPINTVRQYWTQGITNAKIARPSHSRYIAKYVSKDLSHRVRASNGYGSLPIKGISENETAIETLAHFPKAKISAIRLRDGRPVPRKLFRTAQAILSQTASDLRDSRMHTAKQYREQRSAIRS